MVSQSRTRNAAYSFSRSCTTIRGRLCLLLLAVLIPILTIQGINHYWQFQERKANEFEANLEVARAVADTFEGFIQDIIHQELAIGFHLISGQPLSTQEMNLFLRKNKEQFPEVRNFSWVSPEGEILASSLESTIEVDVSDRSYVQEILAGKEWSLGNLIQSRATGEPIFAISRAIRGEEGQLLGIVLAAVLPELASELLKVERVKEGTITLIDREGRAVYRYPATSWDWERRSALRDHPAVRRVLQGEEVTASISGFFGDKERMVALAPVPSNGWVVSASRPVQDVVGPLVTRAIRNGAFLALLVVGVFAAAMIVSEHIVAPLKKLHDHALDLGRGYMRHGIAVEGSKEVQDLASAFNTMAEEVRKREEALEAARLRLFSVLEAMPAFVYLQAPDYSVRYANRTFRETFGDPEGKPCFEVMRGAREPCDGCTVSFSLDQGASQDWEWTSSAGRTYRIYDRPFADLNGSPLVLKVGVDVTEQKQTEGALLKSEEKYRTIFEYSPLGIVHFDQEGMITDCNDKAIEIMGESKEQIVGSHPLSTLKDEKMRAAIAACFSGETGHFEGRFRSIKGMKTTPLKADFRPILSDDGTVLGAIGVIEDFTERMRAEEALSESEKQLRHLSSRLLAAQEEERKRIAGELHDSIGQTLSAMKFSVEHAIANADRNNPDEAFRLLEHLVPIIRNAIEETRSIYMGLRPSILDDLGILATINWFCRDFQKIYPGHYIEVETDVEEHEIPEDLKIVIFRVLQEALNNMAKHSRAELVNISLFNRGDKIELAIEDNGNGYAVNAAPSSENPRRGLGLTSMRERVEFSGGTFFIESIVGEGTIVRASWPLAL